MADGALDPRAWPRPVTVAVAVLSVLPGSSLLVVPTRRAGAAPTTASPREGRRHRRRSGQCLDDRPSPTENSASRSCCEKTSNATIVCVRVTPSSWPMRAGDHLGELLVLADAHDGDEVPLARDRVRLGDALDVGERPAQRRQRRALGLDQDDRVGHAE